jgi:hypothetical protein
MRWLMVMLGLAAGMAAAQGQSENDYVFTGQGWREWSPEARVGFVAGYSRGYARGYLQGFMDRSTIIADAKRGRQAATDPVTSRTSKMTYGQIVAITDKYVTDHPEKWHKHISDLLSEAITKACASEDSH